MAVVLAGVIALCIISAIHPPDEPLTYDEALVYVVQQTKVELGGWLASFAFVGTILRAYSHKLFGVDRERDGSDFLGKLCAVIAGSLAFWVAIFALPDLQDAITRNVMILVAVGLILAGILVAIDVVKKEDAGAQV